MLVSRDPGEAYLLRSAPGEPSCHLERVDPATLEVLESSPALDEGGVWWPGGVLAHADGYLYVTSGRWCHKLDSGCRLVGSSEMPRARPYNSLVPLSDGCLAMKDLIRDGSDVSRCVILDPATMTKACPEVALPEASVARLSADGNLLYVVGDHTLMRFEWDGVRLLRDDSWSVPYRDRADPTRSYGWDVVIGSGYATWLDQGAHNYAGTMRGAAVASGAVRLWRASLADSVDVDWVEPFGLPDACVTNPPLVDEVSGVTVAYDSGNGAIAGIRDGEVAWTADCGQAAHMLLWPEAGVFSCEDWVSSESTAVVFREIRTGRELSRVPVPSPMQSVVFWAPGFAGDMYYVSFSRVGRIV